MGSLILVHILWLDLSPWNQIPLPVSPGCFTLTLFQLCGKWVELPHCCLIGRVRSHLYPEEVSTVVATISSCTAVSSVSVEARGKQTWLLTCHSVGTRALRKESYVSSRSGVRMLSPFIASWRFFKDLCMTDNNLLKRSISLFRKGIKTEWTRGS